MHLKELTDLFFTEIIYTKLARFSRVHTVTETQSHLSNGVNFLLAYNRQGAMSLNILEQKKKKKY